MKHVVVKLRELSLANRKRDDKTITVYHSEGKVQESNLYFNSIVT